MKQFARLGAMAVVSASGGAGLLLACTIYDGSLLLDAPGGSDAADTGADASPSAGDGSVPSGSNTCVHTSAPTAPTTNDGTENLDLVFALDFIRFSRSGAPSIPSPPVGLDLDDLCTCPAAESCMPLNGTQHCDGDGGTDDSAGSLFDTISLLAPAKFGDKALSASITSGTNSLLIRVRSYNGGKNDTQVAAILYSSNGLDSHIDGGTDPPALDGTDVWTIDPSSLLGGSEVDAGATCEGNDSVCIPLFADPEAYVANGKLVAHLDFPLALGTGDSTFVLRLTETTIMGTITRDASGNVHIDDGQVTGRWSATNLLTSLSSVRDPYNPNQFLCGDSGTYLNAKHIICGGADIPSTPSDDGKGKPCDAISAALGFSAVTAHLGQLLPVTTQMGNCGTGYSDSCSN